jgi:hypothetical protein
MQPLALTDEQLNAVMAAAAVIDPRRRGAFLEALAEQLRGQPVGDGSLHRAIALLQPRFHDSMSVNTRHEPRHDTLKVGPPIA